MNNFGYMFSRFFFVVWMRCLHFIKIYGKENVPKKGSFLFTSNHVSLGDPTVLGVASPRPMHFMAKKELFEGKRWGWWFSWTNCIPISRNKKDYKSTKMALRFLKEGRIVALFPEGTRSETGDLKEPELGVGFLVVKSKAPVIPVYIHGTREAVPINGPYKIWSPIKVYIGKPIDFKGMEESSTKREKYKFVSEKIMQAIAELKKKAPSN